MYAKMCFKMSMEVLFIATKMESRELAKAVLCAARQSWSCLIDSPAGTGFEDMNGSWRAAEV